MGKLILKLISIVLVLLSTTIWAQEFQGKAYYQTQRKVDLKLNDSKMSESQKQEMQAMLKKQFEKTFILTFNKEASIYKEEERLEEPSPATSGRMGMKVRTIGSGAGEKLFKNTKTKKYSNERDLFGKMFLVKDNLEVYDWVLGDESKVIGKYLCLKATATREVERLSMSFSSHDNEEESKEPEKVMETQIVTAWFTTDIPVSNGPGNYWGLPGLILELHDGDKTTYLCSKIVMNTKDNITEPTKGTIVNSMEYNEIMKKKMKEMDERFSGGRSFNGDEGIRIGG